MLSRILRHPIFQSLFVFFLLTAIYFIVGKEGSVQSVALTDRYAYAAMGDYAQVVIYQIRKAPRSIQQIGLSSLTVEALRMPYRVFLPSAIKPITLQKAVIRGPAREEKRALATPVYLGTFSFGGRATGVAVQGNLLYVVSPLTGLYVVDTLDPTSPEQIDFFELVGANAVTVVGNYAFVTAGRAGLFIFDVSRPNHIRLVNHAKSNDFAQGVYFLDQGRPRQLPARWNRNIEEMEAYRKSIQGRLYMADGKGGIQIFELRDQAQLRFVQRASIGDVHKVDFLNYYLFAAAGSDGLCVLDVFDELNPVRKGCLRLGVDAENVEVRGNVAYVSGGKGGMVLVSDVNTPEKMEILSRFPALDSVHDIQTLGGQAYVSDGLFGLRVVDIANPKKPLQRGFQETPGEASLTQLIRSVTHPEYRTEKMSQTWLVLIHRFGLLVLIALLFLLIFGQFVLPVSNWRERLLALPYLFFFLLGRHGRMVYIENGRVINPLEDINPAKMRVAWLDHASSALVLRRDGRLLTVGPGLLFLSASEKIVVSLDLHLRTFIYGPELGEAPMAEQGHRESQEMYDARQRRRLETSGQTSDGFEVVPNLIVDFKVRGSPGQRSTPYGYDETAARQAMIGEVPLREGEYIFDEIPCAIPSAHRWESIPGHVAAKAWRTVLKEFDLSELFQVVEPKTVENLHLLGQTTLDVIIARVNELVTQEKPAKMDCKGALLDGEPEPNGFYQQLLEYGIQVMKVRIVNLRFHPQDEQDLVKNWQTEWLNRCREEQNLIRQIRDEETRKAGQQALVGYSSVVIKPLIRRIHRYGHHVNERLGLQEALELLFNGTRDLPGLDLNSQQNISRLEQWSKENPV